MVDDCCSVLRPLLYQFRAGGQGSGHPFYGDTRLPQHPDWERGPGPWYVAFWPWSGWSDVTDSWNSGSRSCSSNSTDHWNSRNSGGLITDSWSQRCCWSGHSLLTGHLGRKTGSFLLLSSDPELVPDPVQGPGVAAETGPSAVLSELDVAGTQVVLQTSSAELFPTGGAGEVLPRLTAPSAVSLTQDPVLAAVAIVTSLTQRRREIRVEVDLSHNPLGQERHLARSTLQRSSSVRLSAEDLLAIIGPTCTAFSCPEILQIQKRQITNRYSNPVQFLPQSLQSDQKL